MQAASDATVQLLEEAGIIADGMTQRGVLTFLFDDRPQPWEVHGALPALTLRHLQTHSALSAGTSSKLARVLRSFPCQQLRWSADRVR